MGKHITWACQCLAAHPNWCQQLDMSTSQGLVLIQTLNLSYFKLPCHSKASSYAGRSGRLHALRSTTLSPHPRRQASRCQAPLHTPRSSPGQSFRLALERRQTAYSAQLTQHAKCKQKFAASDVRRPARPPAWPTWSAASGKKRKGCNVMIGCCRTPTATHAFHVRP